MLIDDLKSCSESELENIKTEVDRLLKETEAARKKIKMEKCEQLVGKYFKYYDGAFKILDFLNHKQARCLVIENTKSRLLWSPEFVIHEANVTLFDDDDDVLVGYAYTKDIRFADAEEITEQEFFDIASEKLQAIVHLYSSQEAGKND